MEETRVRISGIDLTFGEMVVLFTKAALALIPALIVMALVYMLLMWIFMRTLMPAMMPAAFGR